MLPVIQPSAASPLSTLTNDDQRNSQAITHNQTHNLPKVEYRIENRTRLPVPKRQTIIILNHQGTTNAKRKPEAPIHNHAKPAKQRIPHRNPHQTPAQTIRHNQRKLLKTSREHHPRSCLRHCSVSLCRKPISTTLSPWALLHPVLLLNSSRWPMLEPAPVLQETEEG